jgi:hypothetical protein
MLTSVVVAGTAAAPVAAQNYAPPQGAVIDLGATGGPIPIEANASASFYINETDVVNGAVQITFAFRNDSFGPIEFWGADLVDVNTGQHLLQNGNFSSSGLGSTQAADWTYAPPSKGTGFGYASFMTNCGAGNCWVDETAGGYDELRQQVPSVVLSQQDHYRISFFVSDPRAQSNWTFSQYSTNGSPDFGGNGADILAFVGPVAPSTVAPPIPCLDCLPIPEPSTWATVLLGFTALGFLGYRRASALAYASQT